MICICLATLPNFFISARQAEADSAQTKPRQYKSNWWWICIYLLSCWIVLTGIFPPLSPTYMWRFNPGQIGTALNCFKRKSMKEDWPNERHDAINAMKLHWNMAATKEKHLSELRCNMLSSCCDMQMRCKWGVIDLWWQPTFGFPFRMIYRHQIQFDPNRLIYLNLADYSG